MLYTVKLRHCNTIKTTFTWDLEVQRFIFRTSLSTSRNCTALTKTYLLGFWPMRSIKIKMQRLAELSSNMQLLPCLIDCGQGAGHWQSRCGPMQAIASTNQQRNDARRENTRIGMYVITNSLFCLLPKVQLVLCHSLTAPCDVVDWTD